MYIERTNHTYRKCRINSQRCFGWMHGWVRPSSKSAPSFIRPWWLFKRIGGHASGPLDGSWSYGPEQLGFREHDLPFSHVACRVFPVCVPHAWAQKRYILFCRIRCPESLAEVAVRSPRSSTPWAIRRIRGRSWKRGYSVQNVQEGNRAGWILSMLANLRSCGIESHWSQGIGL